MRCPTIRFRVAVTVVVRGAEYATMSPAVAKRIKTDRKCSIWRTGLTFFRENAVESETGGYQVTAIDEKPPQIY